MTLHLVRSFLVLSLLIYISFVGYGHSFKMSRKKRELFPEDAEYFKSDRGHHLYPNSEDLDERYVEYRQFCNRTNISTCKKMAIAVLLIGLLAMIDT